MKPAIFIICFTMLVCFIPVMVAAEVFEVAITGEYIMGDNDTKLEARRMALEHAKRSAAERAGTYLESTTIVTNNALTKDEITSYSSAILKTIIISENVRLLEDKTTLFQININASVDTSLLEKKINEIKADTGRAKQIQQLQLENRKLLQALKDVSMQMKSADLSEYKKLSDQRFALFTQLDNNEKSISITFEKGTLFNLALKEKNEQDKFLGYIDQIFKYYISNVKYKIGEPHIKYYNDKSYLIIPCTISINKNELSLLIERISERGVSSEDISYLGLPKGSLALYFFGVNTYNKLNAYDRIIKYEGNIYLLIKAGNYSHKISLFNIYGGGHRDSGSAKSFVYDLNGEINIEMPSNELANISSIDAELVYGPRDILDQTIIPTFKKVTVDEPKPVQKKNKKRSNK